MNSTTRNNSSTATNTIEVVNNVSQCFILVLALIGNSMFIISLKVHKSGGLKLVDKLMLNTVACNVLLVITSIPIEVVQHYYDYPFPDFVCKLIDPLSTFFFNCCVFTYVAIAFERWIVVSSINHSTPSKVRTLLVFLAIHGCALFGVIPYMPFLKVKEEDGRLVCGETWEISSRKSYTLSLFLLQYGVPVPLLVVFYSKTWLVVYKSNKKLITSLIRSSLRARMAAKSYTAGASNKDPLLRTHTNGSPSSTTLPTVCILPEVPSHESVKDCVGNDNTDSKQISPLPTSSSNSRLNMLRAIRSQSVLSVSSLKTSPFPPADDKHSLTPRQRSFSERSLALKTDALYSPKLGSVIEPIAVRLSHYFSVTGGISYEKSQQVKALKEREKQTRRLLTRFTILTSVFIVCMLPHQVHWLIIDFVENGNEYFSEPIRVFIHLITYANCVINPLLYGKYDRQFCTNLCSYSKKDHH